MQPSSLISSSSSRLQQSIPRQISSRISARKKNRPYTRMVRVHRASFKPSTHTSRQSCLITDMPSDRTHTSERQEFCGSEGSGAIWDSRDKSLWKPQDSELVRGRPSAGRKSAQSPDARRLWDPLLAEKQP